MNNLAGQPPAEVDYECRRELFRARITSEDAPRNRGEVTSAVIGRIGKITLERAWYYWIARGPVPLAVAVLLWEDPLGRGDVRVGGYAGNTEPRAWAGRYQRAMEQAGEPFTPIVDTYHIDSEAGLRLFADMLRAHGEGK